jgi:hypothetical protein
MKRVHMTHVEILHNVHFSVAPAASMRFGFVRPNVSMGSAKLNTDDFIHFLTTAFV